MKKLFTFGFCFLLSYASFAAAGIFEYYMNTSVGNYGNYGGGTSFGGATLASGIDLNAPPNLSITLSGIKAYADGGDWISGGRMFYRVYLSGEAPPMNNILELPQFGSQVGNNTEWQSATTVDLLAGLTASGTYNVDILFEADGNYPGGTFKVYSGVYTATFEVQVALPISLTSFTGSTKANTVVLNWETATEINHDRFEIERATNMNNWESIGEELNDGYDSNAPKQYTFVDERPMRGTNYYRLRQFDLDGTESLTKIIQVEVKSKTPNFAFYPNPAHSTVNVRSEDVQEQSTLRIFDAFGRLLQESHINSNMQIDIQQFPLGFLYFQINEEAAKPVLHL